MILERVLKHFDTDGIRNIAITNVHGDLEIQLDIAKHGEVDIHIDDGKFKGKVYYEDYNDEYVNLSVDDVSEDLNTLMLCRVRMFRFERSDTNNIKVQIKTIYGTTIEIVADDWNSDVIDAVNKNIIKMAKDTLLDPFDINSEQFDVDGKKVVIRTHKMPSSNISIIKLVRYLILCTRYFK